MKNITELQEMVIDQMEKLRNKKSDPATVKAMNEGLRTLVTSVKAQTQYAKDNNQSMFNPLMHVAIDAPRKNKRLK